MLLAKRGISYRSRVSPFWGAHLLIVRRRMSNVVPSSEFHGDNHARCICVLSSSACPNEGRYRPKFNSKSLGTP
jgi:hypothetical protein